MLAVDLLTFYVFWEELRFQCGQDSPHYPHLNTHTLTHTKHTAAQSADSFQVAWAWQKHKHKQPKLQQPKHKIDWDINMSALNTDTQRCIIL